MRHIRQIKIAIILRLTGSAGRDILSGIFSYIRHHQNWSTRLYQMPADFTLEELEHIEHSDYDGIIASEITHMDVSTRLQTSPIPFSVIGAPGYDFAERTAPTAFIRNNDEFIGAMGARFLASLGIGASFAFVSTTSRLYWSDAREIGFAAELEKRRIPCRIFKSPYPPGTDGDNRALRDFLVSLPKPCSIMAAWDARAIQVIEAAKAAKIAIPRQLSIIGVDNDELLDESSIPPLTSIMPDHEKIGFMAASELNRLIRNKNTFKRNQKPLLFPPLKLVERESTSVTSPAAHLISRATSFIQRNATKGINVSDVASFLGCSRQLLDLRFRQYSNETVNQTIVRFKLEAVKKLLGTTNRSIESISRICGYEDTAYLKKLFKKRFGNTMSTWRTTHTE